MVSSTLMEMSIDRIKPDPANERSSLGDIKGLAESIRGVGLVEPLVIARGNGDDFTIVSGERRFYASKELGNREVSVIIQEQHDSLEQSARRLVANIQREDLNPVDIAKGVRGLLTLIPKKGNRLDRVGALIGKDKTWVSGMLKILDMPTKLRKIIERSPHKVAADCVIRIARIRNYQHQRELVENLLDGATTAEIRAQINTLLGNQPTLDIEPKAAPIQVNSNVVSAEARLKTRHVIKVRGGLVVIKTRHRISKEQVKMMLVQALGQAK